MNTKAFYDSIRSTLFKGSLSSPQFKGMEAILAEYSRLCVNDLRKLAYIFATVYHETSRTMQPIEEFGKGRGYDYGKKLKRSRVPYAKPDKLYYGRGLVQLTWYENYAYMGKLLGLDLLNNPELLLDMEVSIRVTFEGMLKGKSSFGDFTGKALENYFTPELTDPVNARRIINGTDKAQVIAGYYKLFYNALILQ
jgi:putative chitinase